MDSKLVGAALGVLVWSLRGDIAVAIGTTLAIRHVRLTTERRAPSSPAPFAPFREAWALGADGGVIPVAGIHPGLVGEPVEQLHRDVSEERVEGIGCGGLPHATREAKTNRAVNT